MNKKTTGLILFWIGVIYMFLMAGVGGWGTPSLIARLSQISPIFFYLWGFSVPVGAILAGVGIMLYTKSKNYLAYAIGIALVVILTEFVLRTYLLRTDAHYPPLFGILGASTLILFSALVWYWAKKPKHSTLKLTGYAFFIIATWYICGAFGAIFVEALAKYTPKSPVNIMIYMFLGWLFSFLGYYQEAKGSKK